MELHPFAIANECIARKFLALWAKIFPMLISNPLKNSYLRPVAWDSDPGSSSSGLLGWMLTLYRLIDHVKFYHRGTEVTERTQRFCVSFML